MPLSREISAAAELLAALPLPLPLPLLVVPSEAAALRDELEAPPLFPLEPLPLPRPLAEVCVVVGGAAVLLSESELYWSTLSGLSALILANSYNNTR